MKNNNIEVCSILLNLAIQWNSLAEIYEEEGSNDCGTGSDVPYAMSGLLRKHADEIEKIAYEYS